MKDEIFFKKLRDEYRFLLESPRSAPSIDMTTFIKKSLHEDLNPPAFKIFSKLFIIHFISGAITLFFCPQLGFAIHPDQSFLLNLFAGFGEYGCMVACGATFLGGTGLVAALLLRSQDIRVIRKTRVLQWALFSFLSLGFFLSVREAENAISFGLIAAWAIGALFGGFFSFQIGWFLRDKVKQHLVS